MGMFDEIVVPTAMLPKPLPKFMDKFNEYTFQTKDLENLLDVYNITDDGRLTITSLSQSLSPKNSKSQEVHYHGDMSIYTSNICAGGPVNGEYYQYTPDGSFAESVDYSVRFTHGKLEYIHLSSHEIKLGRHAKLLKSDWDSETERKEKIIRVRAYYKYLKRQNVTGAYSLGDATSDWLNAEEEIRDEEWQQWIRKND